MSDRQLNENQITKNLISKRKPVHEATQLTEAEGKRMSNLLKKLGPMLFNLPKEAAMLGIKLVEVTDKRGSDDKHKAIFSIGGDVGRHKGTTTKDGIDYFVAMMKENGLEAKPNFMEGEAWVYLPKN